MGAYDDQYTKGVKRLQLCGPTWQSPVCPLATNAKHHYNALTRDRGFKQVCLERFKTALRFSETASKAV